MRQSVGRCVTALVAGALFLVMVGGSGAAAAGSALVAIDLGALGGNASVAGALNDSGQVAGRIVYAGGYAHAFSWTQSGGMIDLGTLGGSNSSIGSNNIYGDPHALNDAGQIVGSSTTASGATHAFSWTPSGGMIDLGTLGGNYSLAEQLNDAGLVVGSSTTASGDTNAFAWSRAGGMVDLGTLGGSSSSAFGVNNRGEVVGSSTTASGASHAFLWTKQGGMVDLGSFGGSMTRALEINENGTVMGWSNTVAGAGPHGFVWTQTGGMIDIGTLGGSFTNPAALSNTGQVVGQSSTGNATHAFSWTPTGGMIDLGTLQNGTSSLAADINDNGQAVGESYFGYPQAFSWTASGGMVPLDALGGVGSEGWVVDSAGWIAGSIYNSTAVHAALWRPVDTSPPTITTPGHVAVDATSPSGATVHYTISATDDVDPAPVVTSTPVSGTMFPIGDTTVTCTATDASGNTATATFVVHVRGAAEQLDNLAAAVKGVGPGKSLASKLADARAALSAGHDATASSILTAFNREVAAQSGKKIAPSTAATLVEAAVRIGAVIG